jgi:hypothetical protein
LRDITSITCRPWRKGSLGGGLMVAVRESLKTGCGLGRARIDVVIPARL